MHACMHLKEGRNSFQVMTYVITVDNIRQGGWRYSPEYAGDLGAKVR
jgi:hypothetical protein